MTEENTISINIDIPKTRIINGKGKDFVKNCGLVTKQPKSKLPSKKISLPAITGLKPLPAVILKKEETLLPYLRYSKHQEKDRFRKRLKASFYEDYKITSNDLRQRLHIDEPVDDICGITDCDPTFFMCVKSSMLSSYVAPYKSLKYLFNTQLRLRQEVGYRRDCMLNIETKYKNEQEIYNSSVARCMRQANYLDEFISADYKKSMSFLSKWEEQKNILDQKTLELQCLAAEMFALSSKFIGLNYRYGLQQKYGRFLYYLSPPSWRLKNRNFARSLEIEAKGFAFGICDDADTFNVIFENFKQDCNRGLVKPVLCFQHPDDLFNIFDGIEQQHLHHFMHVARLAPHTTSLKRLIKLFKHIISQESAGIITVIKEFEEMLLFCEERCSQLESKFFKILNTLFYNNVGAPEVLQFQIHLEFCFAKIYNEKPMNLDVMRTAKALEDFYMVYTERLESITAEGIKTAIKQTIEMERLKFKRAKAAANELRLFQRLECALLRAYAPLTVKKNWITSRSKKKHASPKQEFYSTISNQQKILTETEIEYLTLFTDWTEQDNPANYLRSLNSQDDVNRHQTLNLK